MQAWNIKSRIWTSTSTTPTSATMITIRITIILDKVFDLCIVATALVYSI